MTEHLGEVGGPKVILRYIGGPIGGLMTWLIANSTNVTPAILALLTFIGGICSLAVFLVYQHFFGVLGAGASKPRSVERQDYKKLRESLGRDSKWVELYSRWVGTGLDAVDRFLRDTDVRSQGLSRFPRLRNPAPLWTAPAFDRCLLFALIYPIVAIFVFWAVFGQKSEAEIALGLTDNLPDLARYLTILLILVLALITKHFIETDIRKYYVWLAIVAIFSALLVVILNRFEAGVGIGAVAGGTLISFALAVALAGLGPFAGATCVAICIAYGIGGAFYGALSALPGAAVCAALAFPVGDYVSAKLKAESDSWRRWLTPVLLSFFFVAAMTCLFAAKQLSNLDHWVDVGGPILLLLGFLTLLNAPFDWASLGLTRLLLRFGLERQALWPLGLALLDVILAIIIVVLLVVAMVAGVRAFNYITEWGGGRVIVHLDILFNGIEARPAAPRYWWVYALLFSTMIPSLLNLAVGGASLTRGLPFVRSWLYGNLPEKPIIIPKYKRFEMAAALTVQFFAGAILGVGVLMLFIGGFYFVATHWLGYTLLDLARPVAGLARH